MKSTINSIAAGDLDGDGMDEIVLGLDNGLLQVLSSNLETLWSQMIERYRSSPSVQLVFIGDLNNDGRPEVICGSENWRFYAFSADGRQLWHYEVVHPSRSGAIADIDGDGRNEVICGTHYYSMSVLNGNGTRKWAASFGPICRAVAAGHFKNVKTMGVIAGSENGNAYIMDYDGTRLLEFNTGEAVNNVLAVNLDLGTDNDVGLDNPIAASYSNFIYAWNGDLSRRWYSNLGSPILSLKSAVSPENGQSIIIAGLKDGRVVTLDRNGATLRSTDLESPVVLMLNSANGIIAATGDGRLHCFKP